MYSCEFGIRHSKCLRQLSELAFLDCIEKCPRQFGEVRTLAFGLSFRISLSRRLAISAKDELKDIPGP